MSNLHADALHTLSNCHNDNEEQEALRRRYVDHLHHHPNGVYRECLPDHLTAGMLVLSTGLDQVLLNLHGKAKRWFAFGGHLDANDETLLGAAIREAREESGLIDLRVDPAPVHFDEHEVEFCTPGVMVHHLDVRFTALSPADDSHSASDESIDVRWWPLDALPPLEDEMQNLIWLSRERWLARV